MAQHAPPKLSFFLAAVIRLLLSRLLVFYSNTDSHSLSWSLCSYLTLSSSAAAVWRDILIFKRILLLLYLCWHQRVPRYFSEYLHLSSFTIKCSNNNNNNDDDDDDGAAPASSCSLPAPFLSVAPSFLFGGPNPNFRGFSWGSATEAGSAAFVSFFSPPFLSSSTWSRQGRTTAATRCGGDG